MEGNSLISADILGSYAGDAACEVAGVSGVVESGRHRHRGVRVTTEDGAVGLVLHLSLDWGANAQEVGCAVQERVAEYLERMAGMRPQSVDVIVEEISPPPAAA